jgi:hypothetical protein
MLGRLGRVLILTLGVSVGGMFAHAPPQGAETVVKASATVVASERLIDSVQRATDALSAVPVVPGQRPPFIPRYALVVKAGHLGVCSFGRALTGQCGAIVGWLR